MGIYYLLILDCALITQSRLKKSWYETFGCCKTSENDKNFKDKLFYNIFLRSATVLPNHYIHFCNI